MGRNASAFCSGFCRHTRYIDASLDAGTSYAYRVTAVSDQNSQSPPAAISGSTLAGPPVVRIVSPVAFAGFSVNWTDPGATPVNGRITKLTPVMVVVDDANPATLSWSLQLQPAGAEGTADGSSAAIPLASGTGAIGNALDPTGASAFALDPALYPSGDYSLVLTATDGRGTSTAQTLVSLFSPAKLGGLTLPVTDLTVPIIRSMGPAIYAWDAAALATHPQWWVLTYNGPWSPTTVLNRSAVWGAYGWIMKTAPFGSSLDEFPYASTAEGGMTSPTGPAVAAPVPWLQNAVQGGLLSAFYRFSLKGTPLTPFLVVPIPL
jgi:hypothetical protein